MGTLKIVPLNPGEVHEALKATSVHDAVMDEANAFGHPETFYDALVLLHVSGGKTAEEIKRKIQEHYVNTSREHFVNQPASEREVNGFIAGARQEVREQWPYFAQRVRNLRLKLLPRKSRLSSE